MIVWAHVEHSFKQTFPTRMSEWAIAIILLNWSVVLLVDETLFIRSQTYAELVGMMDQSNWARVCLLLGAIRLIVLIINGAWRRSSHARAICSLLSALFWFEVTIGFLTADTATTGLAIYPVIFMMDAFNGIRALGDAGRLDARLRAGNGSDG